MGNDCALGLGKGRSALGIIPAEVTGPQVAALRASEGAYYKASASGDQRELVRLQPEMDRLTKIAAGGMSSLSAALRHLSNNPFSNCSLHTNCSLKNDNKS